MRALSVGTSGKRATTPPASLGNTGSKLGRKGEGYGPADGFDSVEEGGGTETIDLHASATRRPMPTISAAARQRVNIGRKKLD